MAVTLSLFCFLPYPSYFKPHVRWLRSFTRITYLSKLIGILSLAAFLQLELFRVYVLFPVVWLS
ncbi:hypothetical protein D5074_09845 [Pectobacterium polaris]|nr:hypothetical protein D5074_09845 [Pectobacterium polaris]